MKAHGKPFEVCGSRLPERDFGRWLRRCARVLADEGSLDPEAAAGLAMKRQRKPRLPRIKPEEAQRRARELVGQILGLQTREQFERDGFLLIRSSNGRPYRLNVDGEVFDAREGKFKCVETARNLPEYDEFLAKLLVVRDRPDLVSTIPGSRETQENPNCLAYYRPRH